MLVQELLMGSDDEAWDLLAQATKDRELGRHAAALEGFARLMRADPNAVPFFQLFQRTYVLSGLVALAQSYPDARAELEDLLQERARALALAPGDPHLSEDVARLRSGIASL